ncbi:MAG: hypothetical protein NZO58_02700, partial [Gemmataceae bacterium]|nr:hypothetical protein [Gemmataceae bacterium]
LGTPLRRTPRGGFIMIRFAATALVAMVLAVSSAQGQVIVVQSPPRVVLAPPPVVVVERPVYLPSVAVPAPPSVSYSLYPPANPPVVVPPPVETTVYAAPATVLVPGTITTRRYFGLGIFRPFGVTTETYFVPR